MFIFLRFQILFVQITRALQAGKYGKQTKNSQNRVHNHETEYHKWENNFVFTCIINNFISITVTIYIKTNILNTYLKFPCIIINIVSINMETNKCIILLQLWLKVKLFFAVAMTNMLNMNISTFSSAPTTFTKNGPYQLYLNTECCISAALDPACTVY